MSNRGKNLVGGRKPGSGRPKGSKNINSLASVKKLEALGFDPIEEMTRLYFEISTKIESGEVRKGSGAYAQLIATQGTLINNLMAYGYKKVPEKVEQEISTVKPVAIKLTTRKKEPEDGQDD
jgi:hypothetical protein